MPIEGKAQSGGSTSRVSRGRNTLVSRGQAVARVAGVRVSNKEKRGREAPERLDSLMSYLKGSNYGLYEESRKLFVNGNGSTRQRRNAVYKSNGVSTPTTPSRLSELQSYCGLEPTPAKRHQPERRSQPPSRMAALLDFIN
eukprot:TRINITY_DN20435_c0_g1_i1.p1 TRINITY_DN20435_c0_g1~~TRINITY_DN20435_c0_g1_i1.p1  ORF type:complete len:154 (+),score=26.13 TRINITY_DN20435_c0_g1_i1:40-462(+)